MPADQYDVVKRQVAAHWDGRAAHFDDDFGHSIRTAAERAAWDRIFDLLLDGRSGLDALDAGCGTGFLSFELEARGHHVTGVDFAPAMVTEACRKAVERHSAARFEEADAEDLPFGAASFDLVISRHVLWTLPHPELAVDEWKRVLRSAGRLVVIDGKFGGTDDRQQRAARMGDEYAAVADQLPFFGGRPRAEVGELLRARGLTGVRSDSLGDLVSAQEQRMRDEGREVRSHHRYAVWGDVPA